MSTEKIRWKRVIILIVVLLLIFATIWSETHPKSTEPQVTATTDSKGDSTSAEEETQKNDANASSMPASEELQAQIENLEQQIAEKGLDDPGKLTELVNEASDKMDLKLTDDH